MSKLKVSDKGAELEFNKDDLEFISKISSHNILGIMGDHIAYWRWRNAARIVEKARIASANSNIALNKIPSKFLVEFFNTASLEDDESLQNVWSKILSGEGEKPNTFSMRTLTVLKQMSASDAKIFEGLASFLVRTGREVFLLNDEKLHKKYNISYDKLMILEELGLINLQPFLSLDTDFAISDSALFYTKHKLIIVKQKPSESDAKFSPTVYTLTLTGRELFKVIDYHENADFIRDAARSLRASNNRLDISLHKVNSISTDSNINYNKNDLLAP